MEGPILGGSVPTHSNNYSLIIQLSLPTYWEICTAKAQQTKSVAKFVKIAYPDLVDADMEFPLQPMVRYPDAIR